MNPQNDDNNAKIGAKIRARRKILGFSPQQFANLLGISHQQLYKYENGQNRVSAPQLAKMARILSTSVDYFFSEHVLAFEKPLINDSFKAGQIVNEPQTNALVKNYISIGDVRTRMALVELVISINKYLGKRVS